MTNRFSRDPTNFFQRNPNTLPQNKSKVFDVFLSSQMGECRSALQLAVLCARLSNMERKRSVSSLVENLLWEWDLGNGILQTRSLADLHFPMCHSSFCQEQPMEYFFPSTHIKCNVVNALYSLHFATTWRNVLKVVLLRHVSILREIIRPHITHFTYLADIAFPAV